MNRHQRRAAAAKGETRFAADPDDGKRLAVIRPSKPEVAIALAKISLKHNDTELLDKLPIEVENAGGEYRWMGWLAVGGRDILDHDGVTVVGHPEPGDSFVSFNNDDNPEISTMRLGSVVEKPS